MPARSTTLLALAAAGLLLAVPAAHAQGALSTQGFGYPPGQLSTRALGAGGATGETDPVSPLNPASIINWGTSAVFFQVSPEYRTVDVDGASHRTTTQRYPLTIGALSLGPRVFLALSASTLLDRTWQTTEEGTIDVGGTPVTSTTTYASDGAINDVRLAAAWAPQPWLRVGAGGHALVGRNRLSVLSRFSDTSGFNPLISQSVISYGGHAFSAGAEVRLGDHWTVAGSARMGGTLEAERGDSTISTAEVPTRYGVQLGYLGLRSSMLAVRASHEGWSSLSSLGDGDFVAHDAWDLGAGADVAGPRFGRNVIQLRAGVRRRALPFEAVGEKVTENSVSFGAGTVFANGRVFGDLGVVRASRTVPSGDMRERAWTVNLGLAIQP
jgi:hypothetical protein